MKRKTLFALSFLIALIAVFGLSGTVSAADPKEIKIGLMFGLTGPASPIGPVQMKGAQMAINEINDAGGVKYKGKNLPLVAVIKDDETKGDVAVRRFKELRNEDKVTVW